MNVANGCKAFTVQIDKKLVERIDKVRDQVKMAEFLRRAAADLVEKLEKKGETEKQSWSHEGYEGIRRNSRNW